MKKAIRILDSFFAIFLVLIYSFVIYGDVMLPNEITVVDYSDNIINDLYTVSSSTDRSVDLQKAQSVGTEKADLKFLNIIPVKNEIVKHSEPKKVFVSGQPFGIKLYTDGVIVVGTKDIMVEGKKINPSKQAGIEVGDVIILINNKKVYSSDDVEKILNDNNGNDYKVTVKRGSKLKTFTISPVYVAEEGCYKAGMWVRDSTAGIGTVTFFNPSTQSIATLGHPITDVDTGEIMPILNGEAVKTKVTSVSKSSENETGSLCCDFLSTTIGTLTENSTRGVYGKYVDNIDLSKCPQYEIAPVQEVKKGFAQIICTVDENGPKVYSAEILKVLFNDKEKNMIIKITDKELIEKTGGIVQGMSGTPIIQNGKLVGAITHVIVNDPTKGYGIMAENMLDVIE